MPSFLLDLRYALRRLRHAPVFSAIVILTLALGIGANSAIFSVVNTVLLRPLPYREPGQLVEVFHWYESFKLHAGVSAPGFHAYRDETKDFDAVGVSTGWGVNLTGVGDPQRLRGQRVSGDFFRALGVPAAMGRTFRVDEDDVGHEHVAVISDGLWKRVFGGDESIIGKTASLNGEPYTIIGVMPPEFVDPWQRKTEIWRPLALPQDNFATDNFTNEFMQLVARTKPGITTERAKSDMKAFALDLKKRYPNNFSEDWTLGVTSLMEATTGTIKTPLLWLLAAVGTVLLIACVNVANLLLARAASRQREVAVRLALGARRAALVRQLLVESVILSVVGGALGLVIADASIRLLVAINPSSVPGVQDLRIDGTVVMFTALIAVATGIIFGLVPALQSSKGDLHISLKEGGRGGTADRAGQRLRWTLVVAEMALAVVLCFGGGLLLRSFAKLAGVDPGFDPKNVMVFSVSLPKSQYANDTAQRAFFARMVPRIAQVPGVLAAGATSVMPFNGSWSTGSFNVEGYVTPPKENGPWGDLRFVSPEFLNTLKVPMLAGRGIEARDVQAAPQVCVVDDEFVHRYYGKDKMPDFALGKRIYFGRSTVTDSTEFITIVGVVGHTKHEGLDAKARIQVYFALDQVNFNINAMDVAVRTAGDPAKSTAAVRAAIQDVDRNMPMANVTTLEKLVDVSMGRRRVSTILLGVFSGLALLLASLGIYGVMSYTVAQRTREIGVRVALGASRANVLQLIVGQGAMLAMIGGALGIAGALGGAWVLRSQLFDVQWWDPATLLSIVALLGTAVIIASAIPALRAAGIHPTEALREE
jgi:putative ABC transport system permease protein